MLKILLWSKEWGEISAQFIVCNQIWEIQVIILQFISARALKYKAGSFWLKSAHLGDVFYVYSHFLFLQALVSLV